MVGVKCLLLELFNLNQLIILMNCVLLFFSFSLTILETMTGIQQRFICDAWTDLELQNSLNCLLKK